MWKWKLVYEDETTFSDLDGSAIESPTWGALFVLQPGVMADTEGVGDYALLHFSDKDRWMGVDEVGFLDRIAHAVHRVDAVRFGRKVWTDEWKKLLTHHQVQMRGR